MTGKAEHSTPSLRLTASQASGDCLDSDADDNASVILLPSPPPSSPHHLSKNRKPKASTPPSLGSHNSKRLRDFISDQAIEVIDLELDEDDAVIIITDTEN
jgi:hypothetical protein